MNDRLEMLLEKFRALERELAMEFQKKQEKFFYQIHKKRVWFPWEIKQEHKRMVISALQYIRESRPLVLLTLPIIWACAILALLLDLMITIYQAICLSHLRYPQGMQGRFYHPGPTQPELFECY